MGTFISLTRPARAITITNRPAPLRTCVFRRECGTAGARVLQLQRWRVAHRVTECSVSMSPARRSRLAARRSGLAQRLCVAAIWHHPLFSIGPNGPDPETRELWRTLYEAGADVIINGHDHFFYARFARQTPDGVADRAAGPASSSWDRRGGAGGIFARGAETSRPASRFSAC